MSDYKNLSYISKIFWHFLGPKPEVYSSEDAKKKSRSRILHRLESMIDKNGRLTLKRYVRNGEYYEREFDFAKKGFMADWGALNNIESLDSKKIESYMVKEPKALCFCDIPLNHLPEHMSKYGDIGLGIRREVLESKVDDFFPVHYRPIKNKDDFEKIKGHFLKKNFKLLEFTLKRYSKIPTEFSELDGSYSSKSNTETFKQIYEEREWRTFKQVKLSKDDISFILLPDRRVIGDGKMYPKLKKLINSDVGVIYAEELYGD